MRTNRIEFLFARESDLRQAALEYAGNKTNETRLKLRKAAVAYVDYANGIDQLK